MGEGDWEVGELCSRLQSLTLSLSPGGTGPPLPHSTRPSLRGGRSSRHTRKVSDRPGLTLRAAHCRTSRSWEKRPSDRAARGPWPARPPQGAANTTAAQVSRATRDSSLQLPGHFLSTWAGTHREEVCLGAQAAQCLPVTQATTSGFSTLFRSPSPPLRLSGCGPPSKHPNSSPSSPPCDTQPASSARSPRWPGPTSLRSGCDSDSGPGDRAPRPLWVSQTGSEHVGFRTQHVWGFPQPQPMLQHQPVPDGALQCCHHVSCHSAAG